MALHSPADIEAIIKGQRGETVTNSGETTYGKFRDPSLAVGEGQGGYAGGIITTAPSVLIADGSLSNFGPRKGIGLTVVVDGTSWLVSDIQPAGQGEIRLMLQES